jgi:pimeloyl-ACP methyl ester carboxylesterase
MRLRHTVEQGLFVREVGAPALPPVLWIHGLGESGLGFEETLGLPGLAAWRHVVPDLPGYGRTAWPERPLRFVELADRLAEWLRARGEARVSVVGHSLGGVLAVHLAERHPGLVRALVNVEGNLTGEDCTFSRTASKLDLDAFVSGGFARLREDILRTGLDDAAIRGYYASLRQADPRSYHAHSCELVAESEACTLPTRLAALTHAVLYVAGVPGGISGRSLAALAGLGVRHVRLEPSGHWPFVDQPAAFVDAVAAFLPRAIR